MKTDDAIKIIEEAIEIIEKEAYWFHVSELKKVIRLLKSLNQIVRCKDCKHGVQLDDSNYFVCSRPFASNRETHTADWFCADGERKENGIRMDDRAEERT